MPSILVSNDDVIKLQIYCYETTNTSQVSINTTYWRAGVVGGVGNSTVSEFTDLWSVTMAPLYKAVMSSAAFFRGATGQRFRSGVLPPSFTERAIAHAGAGTRGASMLPPQTAFVISFKTDNGKIRGRNYIPFPSSGDMDANGTPSADYLIAVDFITGNMTSGLVLAKAGVTTTLRQLVYSPAVAPDPPIPGRAEAFTPVTTWSRQDGFGTQRRRGYYGRQNAVPLS